MFFLISGSTNLGIQYLQSFRCLPGTWKFIQERSITIAWLESRFTKVDIFPGRMIITMQRPADAEAICSVEYRFAPAALIIKRRWSGEFCVYVAKDTDLVITSHLKLAVLACGRMPKSIRPVSPGSSLHIRGKKWEKHHVTRAAKQILPYRKTYAETVRNVRQLVYASVKELPDSAALLLSGGLDSAVIAAVAEDLGKPFRYFVFSLKRPIKRQTEQESDLLCARKVAAHLKIRCEEILLDLKDLIANVPPAVFQAETHRGTIIDPCAALIEVARTISNVGFSVVVMAEAADDLFGSFKFALKYKRGQGLRAYYRKELDTGLPDEMAVLQKIFEPWGIALVDPFWTPELKAIGYNIPLSFRLDPDRLMKRILRDAFADMLPEAIVRRPKVITREGSQVRYALETAFGESRERYRPLFKKFFSKGPEWPKNVLHPRNWPRSR
jgi:asparagine synthetase B (glutamine-hydrolysing)